MNTIRGATTGKLDATKAWIFRCVCLTLNGMHDVRFAPGFAGGRTLGGWAKAQKHLADSAILHRIGAP
jgi:hypothetical protein